MECDYDSLLESIVLIGRTMLENGAEVSRVEDSIGRMCKSYGAQSVDVFTITSQIIITAKFDDKSYTQTKRVLSYETNFHQLDELNDLSRYICKHHPSSKEVEEKRTRIMNEPPYPTLYTLLGSIMGAGAFSVFFGGTLRDALCAMLVSLIIVFMQHFLKKKMNYIVFYVFCSLCSGIASILLCKIGLGVNMDKIMIGEVMLLIPGIAMTNSIRDMLLGDTMSGILRLCEALLMAISIALGFGISIILLGGIL